MYTSRSNLVRGRAESRWCPCLTALQFDIAEEDEDVDDDDCSTINMTIAESQPPPSFRTSWSQATSTSARSPIAKLQHTCIAAKIVVRIPYLFCRVLPC